MVLAARPVPVIRIEVLAGIDVGQHQVFLIGRTPVAVPVDLGGDACLNVRELDVLGVVLGATGDDDVMHLAVDEAAADIDAALLGPMLVDCGCGAH